jgi:hypothetical protein
LQAAALDGSEDVIKLLLGNRAEVNIKGGKYGTALAAALWVGRYHYKRLKKRSLATYRRIIRTLLDYGAVVDTDMMTAAKKGGDKEVVAMLAEHLDESYMMLEKEVSGISRDLFD